MTIPLLHKLCHAEIETSHITTGWPTVAGDCAGVAAGNHLFRDRAAGETESKERVGGKLRLRGQKTGSQNSRCPFPHSPCSRQYPMPPNHPEARLTDCSLFALDSHSRLLFHTPILPLHSVCAMAPPSSFSTSRGSCSYFTRSGA